MGDIDPKSKIKRQKQLKNWLEHQDFVKRKKHRENAPKAAAGLEKNSAPAEFQQEVGDQQLVGAHKVAGTTWVVKFGGRTNFLALLERVAERQGMTVEQLRQSSQSHVSTLG